MADDERVDVTDISNSPAFVALNELLNDGTLTAAQVCFIPATSPTSSFLGASAPAPLPTATLSRQSVCW